MKYYSTNHKTSSVELSEAVTRGLAPDGGLFMPERIAQLPQVFFDNLADMSFVEMSQRVARALLPGVSSEIINRITAETLASTRRYTKLKTESIRSNFSTVPRLHSRMWARASWLASLRTLQKKTAERLTFSWQPPATRVRLLPTVSWALRE